MTSNTGSHLIQQNFEDIEDHEINEVTEASKAQVIDALKNLMRPEFLNRIDEIIMFKPLSVKEIKSIVRLLLNQLKEKLKEKDILIEYSSHAVEWLANEGYDPQYGARPLKRLIDKTMINDLSKNVAGRKSRKRQNLLLLMLLEVKLFLETQYKVMYWIKYLLKKRLNLQIYYRIIFASNNKTAN